MGSLQLHQLCLEEESFLQLDQTPTQRRRCLYYLHKSISHLASGYAVLVEFAREILGNGIAWLLRREALSLATEVRHWEGLLDVLHGDYGVLDIFNAFICC